MLLSEAAVQQKRGPGAKSGQSCSPIRIANHFFSQQHAGPQQDTPQPDAPPWSKHYGTAWTGPNQNPKGRTTSTSTCQDSKSTWRVPPVRRRKRNKGPDRWLLRRCATIGSRLRSLSLLGVDMRRTGRFKDLVQGTEMVYHQ